MSTLLKYGAVILGVNVAAIATDMPTTPRLVVAVCVGLWAGISAGHERRSY